MFSDFFDDEDLYQAEFKLKGYPHFDSEFAASKVTEILNKLKETGRTSCAFYPFIRYQLPKYKRNEKGKIFKDKEKPRHIMHTARVDAVIYSFYRNLIMNKYDKKLHEEGINDCVIAYRKIPVFENSKNNKCNVHYANEAIDEIIRQIDISGNCCAIAMDIENFFGSLDHTIIKKQWNYVMGFEGEMPQDHFTIYKNITKYRYIDAFELDKILDINIKALMKSNHKIYKENKAAKAAGLTTKKINLKICSNKDFKEKVIKQTKKSDPHGIPQGTAISDVIANMYLFDFDLDLNNLAKNINGYYRRYSDDILFICPNEHENFAKNFISEKIIEAKLKISDKKTLISRFTKIENEIHIHTSEGTTEPKEIGKPFEYLGLSFDGKHKKIRQSTISGLYDKLSSRIWKEVNIAASKLIKRGIDNPTAEQIYKILSIDMIRNSYMKDEDPDPNREFNGNFYTYVELVAKVTKNPEVMNVFDDLGKWIKKRSKKYCADWKKPKIKTANP